MADCITNLAAARTALHALVTGEQIASVSIDGNTTSYTPADIDKLNKYIRTLEAECGDLATDGTNPSRRGSIKFFG